MIFDSECRKCARLSAFLADVKARYPNYYARPVAPFGAADPALIIVGLAPGMHGANATGRPFTGDYAGILLYETLHAFGFSNRPLSESAGDGLSLNNCRITNAVKCLPPQNKPTGGEINACNVYLRAELGRLACRAVVLALGTIAHRAVLKAFGLKHSEHPFGHNRVHELPGGRYLVDSYHCSRYNIQTRRLTAEMFREVFRTAVRYLDP
ncbi:MAG: uracil-DNA glycosylase [Pseudomonadota bacterium]